MSYRIRTLTQAEASNFVHMTFPAYRALLGNGSLAVGVYDGNEPAGLALVGPSPDGNEAELLSLYVALPHRLCGLGSLLLRHAEGLLQKMPTRSLRTTWSETLPGAKAFRTVLDKCGWSESKKRMFVLKGRMDGDFGKGVREMYPKYESPDCLPRKYTLGPWGEMTEAEREFIRAREGLPNWYEPRANPFREEQTMEPTNSLVLRKEGEIAGWLTVHRTAPDTLRYTDVFIREDLKRAGAVAIAMVTHAFWLHMAEGTPKLTMAVERDNEPLIRMYERRMAVAAELSWTWGAKKNWRHETFPCHGASKWHVVDTCQKGGSMSVFEQFRKGEISKADLLAHAERNPSSRAEIEAMLDMELSDDELHSIAAAGSHVRGTKEDDELVGTASYDNIDGGAGDDTIDGGRR